MIREEWKSANIAHNDAFALSVQKRKNSERGKKLSWPAFYQRASVFECVSRTDVGKEEH